MTLKLKNETDASPTFANVLLYGSPKTGKSTAACSVPGGVLYLNADTPNALHSALRRNGADGRIMQVDLSGGVMDALIDVGYAVADQAGKPPAERFFDTVVVDPVGELHRRMLEEASDRAIRPTLNQYGDVGTQLERFCRMLVEAPVHAIFVCHETPVRDEASGTFERLPFTGTTNPTLGSKLMGMADVVSCTGVRQQEDGSKVYVGQLVSDFGRRGGDRFDALDDGRGYRELDLAEWFRTAGLYLPTDATASDGAAEAQKVKEAA